jgi:hypothetical protein
MAELANKKRLLSDAGYVYSFDRDLYMNREAKKVFSVEFIEDHSEDEIRAGIDELTGAEAWRFYFNTPPSESVRHDIEEFLGL